jgi:hypothetical protein
MRCGSACLSLIQALDAVRKIVSDSLYEEMN